MIEGRIVHKASNALKMTLSDGPGEPLGIAVQGAGDGKRSKLGILFGFKNGGAGRHVLTYADGTELGIESKNNAPSVFTRDGAAFATVERGDTSIVKGAAGDKILHIFPDPVEDGVTIDAFRMFVRTAQGEDIGRLDVIRRVQGWSLASIIDAANDLYIWWDHAGQPMPVPLLGTRLALFDTPTPLRRDVLLCACVDMAIGLRPYFKAMG